MELEYRKSKYQRFDRIGKCISFGITVSGVTIGTIIPGILKRPPVAVVSLIVLGIAYWIWDLWAKAASNRLLLGAPKSYEFVEGSDPFNEFFANWYAARASWSLSVFGNDLAWVKDTLIEYALSATAKQGRLALYIIDPNDPVANQLRADGAKLFHVRSRVDLKHRFSLRQDSDRMAEIIYRDGSKPRKRDNLITFIETNAIDDPHLVGLADEFLKLCYEPSA